MSFFRQLSWFFRQEWRPYMGVVALLCVVSLLQLIPPRLIGWIVDGVVSEQIEVATLFKWGGAIIGIHLSIYALRIVWQIWIFSTAAKLGAELRNRLYVHYTAHGSKFFERYKTGDLMARATNDVNAVVVASGDGFLTAAHPLISSVALLFTMTISLSWELTLLALMPMPLMALFIFRFGLQLYPRFDEAQAAFSALTNTTQEALNGIRTIRAFGIEQRQQAEFDQVADDTARKIASVAQVDAKYSPVIQLTVGMSFFLSIVGGAYLVFLKQLTLGDLTAFALYQGLMIWPMLSVALLLNILQRGTVALNRLQSIFNEKPDIVGGTTSLNAVGQPLQVDIKKFCWNEQSPPALQNITFTLDANKILGVAGPVGCGKSTLVSLILHQVQLEEGTIRYGKHSIEEANLHDWRGLFAVVSQISFLFSRTIAQNIAFGRPNASLEQIRHVAQIACIDEEILQFPNGYETLVGEKGVTLSGGQKQRIAIARALLLENEILILDDSLSAVDGKTERHILQNLKNKPNLQTVIIIAHRLTAFESADQVIVLDQGQIIERGTHASLIQYHNWYKEMHHYQSLKQTIEEMP